MKFRSSWISKNAYKSNANCRRKLHFFKVKFIQNSESTLHHFYRPGNCVLHYVHTKREFLFYALYQSYERVNTVYITWIPFHKRPSLFVISFHHHHSWLRSHDIQSLFIFLWLSYHTTIHHVSMPSFSSCTFYLIFIKIPFPTLLLTEWWKTSGHTLCKHMFPVSWALSLLFIFPLSFTDY